MTVVNMVSIVVPCYNYGKYLAECLNSALNQTYQDFEVIIINDGSTDNTDVVMQPYLKNPKIKYFKQHNSGHGSARNNGIKYSKGEFIAFLDADDLWEKNKLEKQVPLFSNKKIGVVYSRMKSIDAQGKVITQNRYYPKKYSDKVKSLFFYNFIPFSFSYFPPKSGNILKYLFFYNFIPFSSSIIRRKCFEKCGGLDNSLKMGTDWDILLRISAHFNFAFVDEPLVRYRSGHPDQLSKNIEERIRCTDIIRNKFIGQNPDLLPKPIIRKAFAYSFNLRGDYYRNSDPQHAFEYYQHSIKEWPLQFAAYKNLLSHLFRQFINRQIIK